MGLGLVRDMSNYHKLRSVRTKVTSYPAQIRHRRVHIQIRVPRLSFSSGSTFLRCFRLNCKRFKFDYYNDKTTEKNSYKQTQTHIFFHARENKEKLDGAAISQQPHESFKPLSVKRSIFHTHQNLYTRCR